MEKIREKKLVYYIENRSIKISFILYALISLVVGITISVTAIALVDNYRMNLNYKYEDMTTRYDIPENGSFIAKYNKKNARYKNTFIQIMFLILRSHQTLPNKIGL